MDQEDIVYLETLPLELKCYILQGPLTLEDFYSIRTGSRDLENNLYTCLEKLISEGDKSEISPDFVLRLERIKFISPEYPITITTKHELFTLADHPTLKEATFDITDLNITGNDFTQYILNFFSNYKTFGNRCQDCQGRYSFIFINRYKENETRIQVTEGLLKSTTSGLSSILDEKEFYQQLATLVPICEYRGDLNYNLEGIKELPCLKKISLRYNDVFNVRITGEWFYENVMSNKITEYYFSYKREDQRSFSHHATKILKYLNKNNLTYPNVTTFLPISFSISSFGNLKQVFPNLTSIWLMLSSIGRKPSPIAMGGLLHFNFKEIVIVNDYISYNNNLLKEIEKDFLTRLGPELQEKIRFVDSDWLFRE